MTRVAGGDEDDDDDEIEEEEVVTESDVIEASLLPVFDFFFFFDLPSLAAIIVMWLDSKENSIFFDKGLNAEEYLTNWSI